MFAIITFRHTGPIKTWSAMRATNVHNARTVPLDHAVEGAPGPRHLIGSGDLVADCKVKLGRVRIDPNRLHKNGVIAYEAVLSASAAFFDEGTEQERRERLEGWTAAQVDWAMDRYGPHRIASMVLHTDEKTPHIHLVLLPLEVKRDRRRRDTDMRWSLVGRTISGPGQFDKVQDAYAAAMEPFGLRRGERGSGRKHEPVPVYLARMTAKEREVDEERERVRVDTVALIEERSDFDEERAAHAARVAEDERRFAAEREEIARLRAAVVETERQTQAASDRINRNRVALGRVFKAAGEFERRVDALAGMPLTPAASSTMEALIAFAREGAAVAAPVGETRAPVLNVYADIQRQAALLAQTATQRNL